ncbi:hypothetical protein PMI07_000832 [Rhizobium sp. CF080]|uniref:hypothetical protein n=1 Tax=Rhizobium sp. (strain CF080) TaxID=1144310 RepID=UPI000271D626|nr:hypothetical protein [Rhizobium sp. CF080]EUB97256.1 hypothetical protein PMI07_000832 [Rhizobium sp. CF080]
MTGRIPCINPCCKRTASAEKYSYEIICGKCFRNLPVEMRNTHRFYWRQLRKWERRITKTTDELKRERMKPICNMWSDKITRHWDEQIKATFSSEKPEGIDAFLEEMGL